MSYQRTRGSLRHSERTPTQSFSDSSSEQPIILSDEDDLSDSTTIANETQKDKRKPRKMLKGNKSNVRKPTDRSELEDSAIENNREEKIPRVSVSASSIRKRSNRLMSNSKTSIGSRSDTVSDNDELTLQRKRNNGVHLKLEKAKTIKNGFKDSNKSTNTQKSNPSKLINGDAVNNFKMETIRRKISNRIARKQWEEISSDSISEVSKLLNMHVEPVLAGVKSEKRKSKSRKIILRMIAELLDEISGSLVPSGFKSENFNLDKVTFRVQKLQKSYSDNLLQVAELEKTLHRIQKNFESNKFYFNKLEANFKQNVNEFSKEYNIRNQHDKETLEFSASQQLDSSESVNLSNCGKISNLLNIDVEEEAKKFLTSSNFISTKQKEELKALTNYNEKFDEELLLVTQSLTNNLQKLNSNVDVLYKLNDNIEEVYSILK